jgi:hypothetical protein
LDFLDFTERRAEDGADSVVSATAGAGAARLRVARPLIRE